MTCHHTEGTGGFLLVCHTHWSDDITHKRFQTLNICCVCFPQLWTYVFKIQNVSSQVRLSLSVCVSYTLTRTRTRTYATHTHTHTSVSVRTLTPYPLILTIKGRIASTHKNTKAQTESGNVSLFYNNNNCQNDAWGLSHAVTLIPQTHTRTHTLAHNRKALHPHMYLYAEMCPVAYTNTCTIGVYTHTLTPSFNHMEAQVNKELDTGRWRV